MTLPSREREERALAFLLDCVAANGGWELPEPRAAVSLGTAAAAMEAYASEREAAARVEERQACILACQQAVPRAHTYASENADLYRAGDDARDRCITFIRQRSTDQ